MTIVTIVEFGDYFHIKNILKKVFVICEDYLAEEIM